VWFFYFATSGVSTSVPFDPLRHSELHLVIKSAHHRMCEDIFKTLIHKGTAVIPGETSAESLFNSQSATHANVEIFRTQINPPPMYVTECKHVADLHLTLNGVPDRVPIRVKIDFGQVNATVTAMKDGPGRQDVVTASIDWLMD